MFMSVSVVDSIGFFFSQDFEGGHFKKIEISFFQCQTHRSLTSYVSFALRQRIAFEMAPHLTTSLDRSAGARVSQRNSLN
jgi:hypothetical protein